MEPKTYQVKVLHYLNPHLMWVEVLLSAEDSARRQSLFEQVGIFGVLPLDTKMDMLNDTIEAVKSQEWCRGIVGVMDGVLLGAKSVWFSPMEEDDRTSIFDHNIHKYGKFVVLNAEGELVDVAKILAKSPFAYYDKESFCHELKTFQLQTRLDGNQADSVIRILKKCYENDHTSKLEALKVVTSIVQAKQDFENELTSGTRERSGVRILSLTSENISKTLERKQRDFAQCKDIDEVSIGRGKMRNKVMALRKPGHKSPEVDKQKAAVTNDDPKRLMCEMKKMLLDLAKSQQAQKRNTPNVSPNTSNRSQEISLFKDGTPESSSLSDRSPNESYKQNLNVQRTVQSQMTDCVDAKSNKENRSVMQVSKPVRDSQCYEPSAKVEYNADYNHGRQTSYDGTNDFGQDQSCGSGAIRMKKANKKCPKRILPEYDEQNETRVAYGPPDVDKSKLVLKVIPKLHETLLRTQRQDKPVENADEEIPKNGLEGLDSELDYPVSNKDYLRVKLNEQPREEAPRAPVCYSDSSVASKEEPAQLIPGKTSVKDQNDLNFDRFKFKTRFTPSQDSATKRRESKTESVESVSVPKTESRPRLTQRDALDLLQKSQNDSNAQSLSNTDTPNSSLHGNQAKFSTSTPTQSMLKKRLEIYKKLQKQQFNDSSSTASDTSQKDMSSSSSEAIKTKNCVKTKHRQERDSDSDESTLSSIVQKLKLNEKQTETRVVESPQPVRSPQPVISDTNHVNPFKNHDASVSKFVEKHVSPVLMVHSKQDKRTQPVYDLSDIKFDSQIHRALKDMSVKHPLTLQTITWPSILRGCSLFMIGQARSGKTLGYAPAVCRLVADFDVNDMPESSGPIAIIVCATVASVLHVEHLCKRFLGHEKTVLTAYAGVNEKALTLSLLNGCHVFVCTPPALVRLLNVTDFGVDLRRLTTFVLDDCERLSDVYANEIKFCLIKIKEMLRNRADKVLRVQFVVASRTWCEFMEHLARKAQNPMICIRSYQECVLYSKSGMSVNFMPKEKKADAVMQFLRSIDASKRTVIVCRTDAEVDTIAEMLKKHKYVVFSANNSQTVEELYNLSKNWAEYNVPLVGPILVCCDSNLTELNTTNAHNLLHYSLPNLFSLFSQRFAVLIDHYPSMFKEQSETVKIKILLDETNVEQLPKILHFIKRCTDELPASLDAICDKVMAEKDAAKAPKLIPICDVTLTLGECPDIWNCYERHTLFKEHDEPKHWVPKTGHITFTILHYHNAVSYSARLITNIVNGQSKKYGQGYSTLSLKMGMYYTKEANKRPHGVPEVGDICAVAIRENFYERCQVVRVLSRYDKSGKPNQVLVKLIDEEKWERIRDVHLYYLPEDLKKIETHVVQVKLAGVQPKDRDIVFSDLAKRQLIKLTDGADNIYMRAKVAMSISNTVLVDDLEACKELSSMGETVVLYNLKEELLRTHAVINPEHVKKLHELCQRDGLEIEAAKEKAAVIKAKVKELPKPRWAHLDKDDEHLVYFASADNPDKFFVRLEKFEDCLELLTKDIQKYVSEEKAVQVSKANEDDIVLAKFPDDSKYYRARIDKVIDGTKVKCFFVDHGDWRPVEIKDLKEITADLITKLPFQAIECRLVGIKPVGTTWSEYSTNWLCDQCYEGRSNDLKELYVKYFTKEIAECTGGHKYGIALIDTTTDIDVVINNSMIDYNLASENEEEKAFLEELDFKRKEPVKSDSEDEDWVKEVKEKSTVDNNSTVESTNSSLEIVEAKPKQPSLDQIFLKQPIRSVPLVSSSSDLSDEWDIQFTSEDLKPIFNAATSNCVPQDGKAIVSDVNVPAILPNSHKTQKEVEKDVSVCSSKLSDYEVIPSPGKLIEELDSDDFTSPEPTQVIESPEAEKLCDSDISANITNENVLRKPKLHWRQTKDHVAIKILLIGVEAYAMELEPRSITFSTNLLDTEYGFHLDLFGVILPNLSTHASKGQYIYVKLSKLLKKPWETLTLDMSTRKWIVYDPDDINASSDEEDDEIDIKKDTLKKIIDVKDDSDDDDDDCDGLLDDLNFRHRYHRNSE